MWMQKVVLRCFKVCGHCRGQSCINAESTNDEDVDVSIRISLRDVLSVTFNERETYDSDNG